MRLMMGYTDQNRGYAFIVYCNNSDAKECVKLLNNYEIRQVMNDKGLIVYIITVMTYHSITVIFTSETACTCNRLAVAIVE